VITLAAGQADLVARGSAAPIVLAHLEIFSDYTLETVATNYYWTLGVGPVRYPWNAADRDFDPVIAELGNIARQMNHLPNADDAALRRASLELRVANLETGSGLFWKELRAANLPRSRLTVAVLLVDPDRRSDRSSASSSWWDFTDHAGTEHTILYRGELVGVPQVTLEGISLSFATLEPSLDWPTATDPTEVDPKDLGKRYPLPVGESRGVACINRRVGWVTTIAEELAAADTGVVAVSDATGFPSVGTFTLQIGAERVTAAFVSAFSITISVRGILSTAAGDHKSGAVAIEVISSTKLVAAGSETSGVRALYVVSPITKEKTLVSTSRYTVNAADTTLDTGSTLTVVTISSANMRALFDELAAASAVTAQPEFESGGDDTVRCYLAGISPRDANNFLDPGGAAGTADESGFALLSSDPFGGRFDFQDTRADSLSMWVPTGTAQSAARICKRFRVVLFINHQGHFNRAFDIIASYDFFGFSGDTLKTIAVAAPQVLGTTLVGPWETLGTPTAVSGLERSATPTSNSDPDFLSVFLDYAGTGAAGDAGNFLFVYSSESYVECELEPEALTRTTDTAVSGPSSAVGLQFIADVIGVGGAGGISLSIADPSAGAPGTPATEADTAAEWSITSGVGTISDDAVIETDGSSIRFDWTSGVQFRCGSSGWATPIDLTGKLVRYKFRTNNSDADAGDFFIIGLADSGGLTIVTAAYQSTVGFVEDFWYTGILDPSFPVAGATGDLTDWAEIEFLYANSPPAGLQIWLDAFEVIDANSGDVVEVLKWVVEDFGGLGAGALEASAAAAAKTALGTNVLAGDLRTRGDNFGELLSALAFEGRVNVTTREGASGTEYRLTAAGSSYDFGAATELEDARDFQETVKPAEELATRFRGLYEMQPWEGEQPGAFKSIVRIGSDVNDITPTLDTEIGAAEDARGLRVAEPAEFRLIQGQATAEETLGYYASEGLRVASRFGVTVPWSVGFALELGDIRSVTPPWSTVAIKCRVIGVVLFVAEARVGLNLEEVL